MEKTGTVQNKHSQAALEAIILAAVRELRYGTIEITVHDSRIVQMEKTEKLRFQQAQGD